MTHAAVLGGVVAPLAFLGGTILVRAAWLTAGVVGGNISHSRQSTLATVSIFFLNLQGIHCYKVAFGFGRLDCARVWF